MATLNDSTTARLTEIPDILAKFSCLDAPIDKARGLPNSAFTSEVFFEFEQERLFARSWIYAARQSAIPNSGDVIPVNVAGQPIFIVRQADGTVRAFYNVCLHRGARLVSNPCRGRKTIVCPYHSWAYELDGTLCARPHYFGPGHHDNMKAASRDEPRLFPVRSAIWHDWIFVNLDGNSPQFESFLAPVNKQWGDFNLSEIKFAHHLQIDFRANWKLVIENYFDFYHVFKVHPTFHKKLSKSLRQPTKGDGHFLHNQFWEEDTHPFVSTDPSDPALPPVSRSNESGLRKSVFGVLFPNSAVNIHGTDLQFTHLEPLAPNHTRMHRYFYFIGNAATSADYLRARQRTYEAWTALLQEDVGVCERAQEGRRCNAYDGGRFAPSWDSAAHYFHKLVADVIASETNHHPT